MGQKHILWVIEDGISRTKEKPEALGEAVLKVCLNPDFAPTPDGQGLERVWWRSVLGVSCVNWVDDVHQSDIRLYLWGGNCLRPIRKLDDEDLEQAAALLQEEIERRAKEGKRQGD